LARRRRIAWKIDARASNPNCHTPMILIRKERP
jgi:hypothetical protein